MKRSLLSAIALMWLFGFCNPLYGQTKSVFYQSAEWSPDGEKLVFAAIVLDSGKYDRSRWELYLVSVDGSHLTRLTRNNQRDLWPAWSPDGQFIVYESVDNGDTELYTINKDGGDLKKVFHRVGKDLSPSWSPDGRSLAFVADIDGHYELCTVNVDGSGFTRLTNSPHKEYNPAWSPDGKYLIYYDEKGDGLDQVYAISLTMPKRPIPITRDTLNNVFPGWYQDGVLFSSSGHGGRILLKSIANDCLAKNDCSQVPASELPVTGFFARISPNGQRVAYLTGKWPNGALMICNRDGSQAKELIVADALLALH